MIPLKLELRNFMAYRDADPLDLSGLHVVCLTGDNGAGKSTLLDAMTWSLWGQSRAGRDDELIAQGAAEMRVAFTFSEGRDVFQVVRTRKHGKAAKSKPAASTGTLDLLIRDESVGGWRTLSEGRIVDTQAAIERTLNLSYDTFINSAYLKQGRADEFTVKQPGQRKQLLAEILDLDVWATYEERVKQRLNAIDRESYKLTQDLEQAENELALLPQYERQLGDAQAALDAANAALTRVDAEYRELVQLRERAKGLRGQMSQVEQRLRAVDVELNRARGDHDRAKERVRQLQAALDQRAEIEAGYATLLQAQAENERLSLKLTSMVDLNARKSRAEAAIVAERHALEKALETATRRVNELRTAGDVGDADARLEQVRARLAHLASVAERASMAQQRRMQIGEELGELRSRNETLRKEMNDIKARMQEMGGQGAICPTCGRMLDVEARARMLSELEAEGRRKGDEHRANDARRKQHEEERAVIDAEAESRATMMREQPTLQREEGRLAERCARAADAARRLPEAEAELQNVAGRLAEQSYAVNARADLRRVEAELAELGYDAAAHDRLRNATLPSLQPFAGRKSDVERAEVGLQAEENLAAAVAAQIELLQARDADERRVLDGLRGELAAIDSGLVRAAAVEQALVMAQTTQQECHRRYGAANQRVQACRLQAGAVARMTSELQALRRRQGHLEELRAACGKNGVPAMIIESALPELEAAANDLLGRMTNGRMNVRFDTQRLSQKGEVVETLEIRIADEIGERAYEMFSGGEAFRINFAVRIALSRMLARRAGAALRTLFIDEGFGTQDAQGRERLVEAIKTIEGDFERIFVITHIEELKDAFPARIEVTKSANGSAARVL